MGKSFEEQIKESLEGYREQPSENCWDALSHQLDALHQVPSSTQAPLTEAARTSATKSVLGSTAVKAGIGVTVVGGMIAAGVWLFASDTEETPAPSGTTPGMTIADNLSADSLHMLAADVHTPQDVTPSNTTFSEGVPAFLLEENEEARPAGRSQAVPSADSTRGYCPQPAAVNSVGRATVAQDKAEAFRNVPSSKTTDDEADGVGQFRQPELRIPNIITPNGDNLNDYFVIENLETTESNRLIIYNRSNRVVFEQKNYGNSWNADNLPDGIYRYWLSFKYEGHEFMRQGSITVKR